MKPYYQDSAVTIYHGDCREILPDVSVDYDLILTDPPYGIRMDTSQLESLGRIQHLGIFGDDEAFNPDFLIQHQCVLWGGNNFANRLPIGGWICWDKRVTEAGDKMLGSPFELAWCSNPKLFKIIRIQHGGAKNADAPNGEVANQARFHPTQKPVSLMTRCISFFPNIWWIVDPFMGSGSTLIAAKELGRRAIGIDIEEKYCEIAARRMEQEVLPLSSPAQNVETQGTLLHLV